MTQEPHNDKQLEHDEHEFAQYASKPQAGMANEFVDFLLHNKKWWLTPIILVLVLIGVLLVLGGTGAAPFIYTLF